MSWFDSNIAEQNAGVLYLTQSKILFTRHSVLTLTHNKVTSDGGAFYFDYNPDVFFSQFTNIMFNHNSTLYGGAVSANDLSNITVTGSSVLSFVNNEASQSAVVGLDILYFSYFLQCDYGTRCYGNIWLQQSLKEWSFMLQ